MLQQTVFREAHIITCFLLSISHGSHRRVYEFYGVTLQPSHIITQGTLSDDLRQKRARAQADNAAATRRCFPPRTSVSSSPVCMYSGANCQRTPTLWRSRTFAVPAVMHPSSVNMKIWLERAGAVVGRALCGDNGRAERPALGLPSAITFSPLHSHLGYECGLDLEKECRESGKSLDDTTRREAP